MCDFTLRKKRTLFNIRLWLRILCEDNIVSRPGRKQGLLYKDLCHSLIHYWINSLSDPLVKISLQRLHAQMVKTNYIDIFFRDSKCPTVLRLISLSQSQSLKRISGTSNPRRNIKLSSMRQLFLTVNKLVWQKNVISPFFGRQGKQKYRCYYPHRSRDLVSPV